MFPSFERDRIVKVVTRADLPSMAEPDRGNKQQIDDIDAEENSLHCVDAVLAPLAQEASRDGPHGRQQIEDETSHKNGEELAADVCYFAQISIARHLNRMIDIGNRFALSFVTKGGVTRLVFHRKVEEVTCED